MVVVEMGVMRIRYLHRIMCDFQYVIEYKVEDRVSKEVYYNPFSFGGDQTWNQVAYNYTLKSMYGIK